ncbi:osmotically-inducible protein OsmY [Sphaerotilus sulfidivorans]|jgi:osmotically-inducible protein OsmY|nr:BON domain-containing protein [Sphaerotilus sulfidivorans]NZD48081.1 BON domain-containing protein [Sphaerotilus sulfidivorans]
MRVTTGKLLTTLTLSMVLMGAGANAKSHGQTSMDDLALAEKVEFQLKGSGILENGLTEVHAKAKNGEITLSGWLQHADDDRKVMAAAKNVDGVSSVKANFRAWSSRRHPS